MISSNIRFSNFKRDWESKIVFLIIKVIDTLFNQTQHYIHNRNIPLTQIIICRQISDFNGQRYPWVMVNSDNDKRERGGMSLASLPIHTHNLYGCEYSHLSQWHIISRSTQQKHTLHFTKTMPASFPVFWHIASNHTCRQGCQVDDIKMSDIG